MKKYLVLFVSMWLIIPIKSQIPEDSIYFGFDPPGDSAVIFAPGFISIPSRKERTPNYLPDYSEFYFTTTVSDGAPKVYSTKYTGDKWEVPAINPAFPSFACDLSITDSTLACFTSNYGNSNYYNTDIWIMERTNNLWKEPYKVPGKVNSSVDDWGACILQNLNIYVCKYDPTPDIIKYVNIEGDYPKGINLNINSEYNEWDPFVPEDESYIIFKSNRSGGFGDMDLYISYLKEDKTYTNPKNLGSKINSAIHDDCGNLTPDGKFFLFGRNNRSKGEFDIYWVSSNFIDSLKYTNYIPYVKNYIPDQEATIGNNFSYTIPDSIFIDDDGNETLIFTAELSDGNDFPDSLSFDPLTNTISGKLNHTGSYNIKVTATDTAGETVSDVFTLEVKQSTNVSVNIFESEYLLVCPNPANQTIQIKIKGFMTKILSYQILDLYGRAIKQDKFVSETIDISDIKKGIYIIHLQTDKKGIRQKIVIE